MSDFAGISVPKLKNLLFLREYSKGRGKMQAPCFLFSAIIKAPQKAAAFFGKKRKSAADKGVLGNSAKKEGEILACVFGCLPVYYMRVFIP